MGVAVGSGVEVAVGSGVGVAVAARVVTAVAVGKLATTFADVSEPRTSRATAPPVNNNTVRVISRILGANFLGLVEPDMSLSVLS
jgi:hypothetical protein